MSLTRQSQFGRNEVGASLVAAVVAATVAGGVMQAVGGIGTLGQFAQLIGADTLAAGWTVWFVQSVVLGVAFALGVSWTINPFTDLVMRISRTNQLTRTLLVPLLRRSALAVTAGSLGFLYGQFVLVPVFAYLAPVALTVQGDSVGLPLATVPVVLGYIVYGSMLGTAYGRLLETTGVDLFRPDDEHVAALVGAVVGGVAGTGVLAVVGGTETLATLGAVTGTASVVRGALLFVTVAVGFGLAFAGVLARTINDFTNTVIMFSRRSELTQKILVPLLSRAALTVTAGSMGLIYGLVLGIVAVGLGAAGVLPQTGVAGLLACTLYGYVLGTGYGVMMEDVDLSGLGPSEEQRAGLVGSVGAGLLSCVVVALLPGPSVLDTLATLVGADSPLVGVVVWLGVAVVFGLVFVAYVSRTINDFTNTVIMFSRRSELTQKILVPLLTRAALTVTAGSMGILYGFVLGVLVYGGVLVGVVPQVSPLVVVAFAIYGQALGTSYGLLLEDVDLRVPFLSRGDDDTEDSVSLVEIDSDWRPPVPFLFGEDDETETAVSLIEYDSDWRPRRPASGALLLLASGGVIGGIPLRQGLTVAPSPAALGIVFGAMLVACGLFALVKPQLSALVGVTGVGLATVSIIAGFGGLFVGMVLGLVGGTRCIVWEDPAESDQSASYGFVRVGESDS